MAKISESQNEYTLIRNIMLGLLILNLSTLLFSYMVTNQTGSGSTGLGCSQYSYNTTTHQASGSTNPACNVQAISSGLTNATYNFTNSFNYRPYKICNVQTPNSIGLFPNLTLISTNSCSNWFTPVSNFFLGIANFFSDVLYAVGYMFLIIFLIASLMFAGTIGLAPAIFYGAHLGIFSTLFTIVYGFSIVIVIAYAVYLIINRIEGIT